ncbi:hypothetical protein G6M40_14550 [Agrobacterium tumefaciens]|uniref:Uncharacterized protein n=2 Tax=Agrobacterium tumefaciens TaxID=358 RepID=A0AA44J8H7_AGRTU|nr:hypothetical protein [Agrobacterium tumefaciens]NTC16662.1 hypothetical protein [Agrobacterium tumefaciens]NTC28018.1 hypothetical protein [Agrobacterium tumefaciens]NTC58296.1 hypothetical protein [Agrobacterium tumefaciens]NTC60169.1 hypothetical protein [Agrobacterium tumefaciens]
MGTSKTSSGPGKNVPLVPNWVGDDSPKPPLPSSPPFTGQDGGGPPQPSPSPSPAWDKKPDQPPPAQQPEPPKQPLAPPRRFTAAKRAIGDFTKSGDQGRLRKALGNYVRSGYGGSATAARRMGKSASAASGVYNVLSRNTVTNVDGSDAPVIDLQSLAGLSHSEVAERIAEAVNPGDISLDDAGTREAVAEAVSSVLSENADADVTDLPPELVEECYVRTLSISVFNILLTDIGASVTKAAHGNAVLANDRLKEISDFVREAYRVQYDRMKGVGTNISRRNSDRIARDINAQVMDIFESYLE